MAIGNSISIIKGYPIETYKALEAIEAQRRPYKEMTLDECLKVFREINNKMGISKYNNHNKPVLNYDIWEYYKGVYDEIPSGYRLRVLFELYLTAAVNYKDLMKTLKRVLEDESPGDRLKRIQENRLRLKDHLKGDWLLLYRGEHEKGIKGDEALSYTLDLEVARWFSTMNGRKGWVIQKQVHIDNILWVFDENGHKYVSEAEVIILPEVLKKGLFYGKG